MNTPESAGQKILDGLSTEELKSLMLELNVQSDQPAGRMDWQQIQQEFVDTHPDFLPVRPTAVRCPPCWSNGES